MVHTRRKRLIFLPHLPVPTPSNNFGIPQLRRRPARDPQQGTRPAQDKVDGDDDENQEPLRRSSRDAQHSEGEGRLAPGCAHDGAESGCVGELCGDGDVIESHVGVVEADAVSDADREHDCR